MQNPKTGGSRWVPDIRPENIDTYTEQDGEQSAQYKIVDAHPIIGGVLDKLAFFRTHASAVWYNKMKNITVLQKLDNLAVNIGTLTKLATTDKTSLVAAINELNGNFKIGAKNIYDIIDLDDKIEVIESYVKINKSTVDLYARIVVRQVLEDAFLGIVKPEYESAQRYTIFPYYSSDAPYNASGSLWVSGVVSNVIRMYNTVTNKQYYINARWLRNIV